MSDAAGHARRRRSGAPARRFTTVSGICRSSGSTRPRISGPDWRLRGQARAARASYPFTRGIHPDDVPRPAVDDAAVRGLRLARRRPTRASTTSWSTARPACRPRSTSRRSWGATATTPWPAARWAGRASPIDTLADMEIAVRRDPARPRLDLDDDQRARRRDLRHVPRGRREAGRRRSRSSRARSRTTSSRSTSPRRSGSTRRARACGSSRTSWRFCARERPEVEHDLDLRLPHPRGRLDGGAGAGVHAGRRDRLRRRRASTAGLDVDDFAPAAVVLLQLAQRLLRGDRQDARGAPHLGARHARALRREEPALVDAALPHADRRLLADRAAALQQHRARHGAGAGRGAGRHAVAAHRTRSTRRSRCPREDAVTIALRTQQILAEESGVTNTVDPLGGSYFVEALTDRMERDAMDYIERIDADGRHDRRDRGAASRRRRSPTRRTTTSARSTRREDDRRRQPLRDARSEHARDPAGSARRSSASSSRASPQVKARRDAARLADDARRAAPAAAERGDNLIPLMLDARARLRHGAARSARRWSRSSAPTGRSPSCEPEREEQGRAKLRLLVGKVGLDGHDRGAKIIARALRDAGLRGDLHRAAPDARRWSCATAIQEDVDAVSLSILSGAHNYLFPRVHRAAAGAGRDGHRRVRRRHRPRRGHRRRSRRRACTEIFTPGSDDRAVIAWVRANIQPRARSAEQRKRETMATDASCSPTTASRSARSSS